MSSTVLASVSISGADLISPRLSRSHCTSEPVTAIEPSSAYTGRLVADLVADRGQQAVLAGHLLGAGVEQHEVAGAVGVLGLADLEAGLAERGRLLVAEDAGDRHAAEHAALADVAVHLGGGPDLRQHRQRDAHLLGDVRVPGQRVEVHQHGARGVGRVGDVQAAVGAAGHVPDQPGVDVAEHQVARLGLLPGALDVVEDPATFGPEK